jgi:hypothetical protein
MANHCVVIIVGVSEITLLVFAVPLNYGLDGGHSEIDASAFSSTQAQALRSQEKGGCSEFTPQPHRASTPTNLTEHGMFVWDTMA